MFGTQLVLRQVGILVETWTDNLNRTSADIRSIANKHRIKVADPGSLTFKFCKKGRILLRNEDESVEDQLVLDVAEVGVFLYVVDKC